MITPVPMRDAFLEQILIAMSRNEKIFFTCADFGSPILDDIRTRYPSRFVNVGIAEQNLINVSAGLALEGFTVFAYAIAPFITMRCYEQIRISLALLSQVRPLNVNLIGVGAGYSYVVSGPTHQCYEDLTIMRALPNIAIYSPADHVNAVALFEKCIETTGPKYLRFDAQKLPVIYEEKKPDIWCGFHLLRESGDICIVATGYMVHTALQVAEQLVSQNIELKVIDLFDLTDFDTERLLDILSICSGIVTLEEGFEGRGGLDALIFNLIHRTEINIPVLNIGVTPGYSFELGSRSHLHEQVGIGVDVVEKKILMFAEKLSQ